MKNFSIPKGQRHFYFILIFGAILAIITVSIAVISLTGSTTPSVSTPTIAPTPFIEPFIQINTPIRWNQQSSKLLLHREEQRTPLSSSDAQAKVRILQLLPSGQNYGAVYSSTNIIIEYVQSLDLFQVETLTINVEVAKNEAESWFKQEGMSQQGICDLPLGFYPGWASANILKESNYVYNELPDGC